MRIDIKPVNTKGREIVDFKFEFIELEEEYFIYAGKMTNEEWDTDEDDDESDIDNLIKATNSKRKVNRAWYTKVLKNAVHGIERFYGNKNEAWEVQIFIYDDSEMIAFATEDEATEFFEIVDKWLFNN